jgi:RecJ-like exonuclease
MNFCTWCNGYGSSLKDPEGVDRCTRCGGSGIRTPAAPVNEKRLSQVGYERHVCQPNPIECTVCHGDGTGSLPA